VAIDTHARNCTLSPLAGRRTVTLRIAATCKRSTYPLSSVVRNAAPTCTPASPLSMLSHVSVIPPRHRLSVSILGVRPPQRPENRPLASVELFLGTGFPQPHAQPYNWPALPLDTPGLPDIVRCTNKLWKRSASPYGGTSKDQPRGPVSATSGEWREWPVGGVPLWRTRRCGSAVTSGGRWRSVSPLGNYGKATFTGARRRPQSAVISGSNSRSTKLTCAKVSRDRRHRRARSRDSPWRRRATPVATVGAGFPSTWRASV
jgi:hypothetical protein